MIMSTSIVILEVENIDDIDKKLNDIAYEDDKKFKSLTFDSPNKTTGEIHWSNSFNYGKMNMISFVREENFFYLFTSAVDNKLVLADLLSKSLNDIVHLTTLKTPLNSRLSKKLKIPEIEKIEINKHFGISAWLNIENWRSLIKIYTNGLITYKMTNDLSIIMNVVTIAKKLIKECENEVGK